MIVMKAAILRIARRRQFQRCWERLHRFALVAMNYWASDLAATGELQALRYIATRCSRHPIVFDVGANIGEYSEAVIKAFPKLRRLHSFEPSRATAKIFRCRMAAALKTGRVELHVCGMSDRIGERLLRSGGPASGTASLHKLDPAALSSVPHNSEFSEIVQLGTVDDFCQNADIKQIDLLKIDVEGHELFVLRGARKMLRMRAVRFVQFEFGAFNLDSRTYLRDLFSELQEYKIFRVLPDGLIEIDEYHPRLERFATMNYLAELRNT